jgi:DNA-binding MarR family transcriptional regulator
VSWRPCGSKLDQDIFDAMTEFVTAMLQCGERLAVRFDVPVSCLKAIRRLDRAVSMRDLGQQLHCDPSFVTMIADSLEQRGLAKREPGTTDRRVKNLVLTPHGLEVKALLEQETFGMVPWAQALTQEEREQLLALIRKMNDAISVPSGAPASSGATAVPAEPSPAGPISAEGVTSTSTALPAVS